ncbi:3'-5' exonuclease [Caulobacter sp. Root343]|uniref:3'-5' exonuclease n=1 Tax=Caulobacter sp. Root343 TaxID=1736520 RepID=UPI0006F33AEC|nr:3'-5' exonuclease [Caulobacter sp. Root343]KQV66602.1 hypothetical protein ASC70_12270 [Caulobacter sp. Root343]
MIKLHICHDLETWGNFPGASIASIGAVAFDPAGAGLTDRTFYRTIDRESAKAIGLIEDPGTVEWWDAPKRAVARAALDVDTRPIMEVLAEFSAFYIVNAPVADETDRLWSNGPSYDETLLGAAYRAAGIKPPWRYNAGRDCRTIYDLFGLKLEHSEGVFHHALDDAREQALLIQEGYRRLNRVGVFRPADVCHLQGLQPTA